MAAGRRTPVRVRILASILAVTAVGLAVAGGVAFLLQHGRVLAAIDEELRQEFSSVQALIDRSAVESASPEASAPPGGPAPAPSGSDAPAETTDPLFSETPSPEQTAGEPAGFASTGQLVYEVVRVIPPPLGGGTLGMVDGRAEYVPGMPMQLDLNTPDFTDDVAVAAGASGIVLGTATLDGREVRYLAVPLATDGSASSGLFISAIAVDARLEDLRSVMAVYAWVAFGVLLVVALVGWIVAGRLLQPVRELRRTAARITAGALDERIPVTGNDDLSDLTETINAMIARLEEAFQGQRRIVNDVRHELATPVTIVRGHLELVDPSDPDDVEQTRAIVMDELDRMSGLISQIAHLAEAERRAAHRPDTVDAGALTREVFEKVRVIPDRDWRLGPVATGPAVVDQARVTQAWLQLADNAAKYSEPGAAIEIGSSLGRGAGDELRCWVADEGRGIPEEARARIFERFGRAGESRGTAGSGLGLAIVQALVRAHGGRIELDSEVGRGSRFTMVLPRRPAAAEQGDDDERGTG